MRWEVGPAPCAFSLPEAAQDAAPSTSCHCAALPGVSGEKELPEQFAGEVRLCSQVPCGQLQGLTLLSMGQLFPPPWPRAASLLAA